MIEVRGLHAAYGKARVLFGVDFSVHAGEVLALVGRNGAGKSTTLKCLIGMVTPSSGEIRFAGERTDGLPPFRIARLGLGYVPEDRRIFTDLTVRENLEVGRLPARGAATSWTPARLFELFPSLGRMQDRLGGRMSGGEQQMLALARTLMGNPRALLLDEPFEGLAPVIADQLVAAIRSIKREGHSLLLCEQNLRFARQVADRACLIETGKIVATGTLEEVRARYAPA